MERDRLLGVSYAQFRGGGPSAPKFLGTGPSTYTGRYAHRTKTSKRVLNTCTGLVAAVFNPGSGPDPAGELTTFPIPIPPVG